MNFEQIIVLTTALGVGGWLGKVIQQFLQNKGNSDIKKLENQNELFRNDEKIKDLKEEIKSLIVNINLLKIEVNKFKKLYQTEKKNTHKVEQQLATINVAFDIIYVQLKNILSDDESHFELLNQLKKYIDSDKTNT